MDEADEDQSETSTEVFDCSVTNVPQTALNFTKKKKKVLKPVDTQLREAKQNTMVYVCNLPTCLSEVEVIEKLKQRLENICYVKIVHIKCYLCFGIASVTLSCMEDKWQLINKHKLIVFDTETCTLISFVDNIKLDSYIVLDPKQQAILTAGEIVSEFAKKYSIKNNLECECISSKHFPNIFHIVTTSLEDMVPVAKTPSFQISNIKATVYSLATCSFIEDLPSTMTDTELSAAIHHLIFQTKSTFIQINKATCTAVILVPAVEQKWSSTQTISLNGENIAKKVKLSYRILLTQIPQDIDTDSILEAIILRDHVKQHKRIDDRLIIELDDENTYEQCLAAGGIFIKKKSINIVEYCAFTDPGQSEINAETWYDTEMLKIKPNISSFLENPDHSIFHYQWNAQCWSEQFQKASSIYKDSKECDRLHHLLRVTVMLNTIGTLKKQKYMVDNDEVLLPPGIMKTIIYDHKSKIALKKTQTLKEMKPPYASTEVLVLNEDCVDVYEKLVSQKHHPVLLNMASATSPGGGYRKGDGAQEENIFRRSNYYHSLDLEIADPNQSERYVCKPDGQLKRLDGYSRLYPMEEFGAIYTSGITVFRRTESEGYTFMKKPLYNVCAIAMAAHRNPEMKDSHSLTDKILMSTHRKISNIFSIAHAQKHDCLVLSAFGCGAFKNPPRQMASIFKSVILQYAGYFHTIYFAIIDDHNTMKRLNPQGNFLPYQEILHNINVSPLATMSVGIASGSYRILNLSDDQQVTTDDIGIGTPPICNYGGQCHDLNDLNHSTKYLHPSSCPKLSTMLICDEKNDDVHKMTFFHTVMCEDRGKCESQDPKHFQEFVHPDWCSQGSRCSTIDEEHLNAFRHVPLCRDGLDCSKYVIKDSEHCHKYRHCKSLCPEDNYCAKFLDMSHMKNTIHSFSPPCPFTPYNCKMYVKFNQHQEGEIIDEAANAHCLRFSHVCLYGRQCKTKNEQHLETTIHIARKMCPDSDHCSRLTQEDHLESFSHPNIRDIRLLCKHPGYECRQKSDLQHFRKYRHGENHDHLSIAPSGGFNASINFVRNQNDMIKTVNRYVTEQNWCRVKPSNEILSWIRALQPVHRCSKEIFESILVLGHVMSLQYMDELKNPDKVALAVRQHSRVRLILLKNNTKAVTELVYKFIDDIVQDTFEKEKETSGHKISDSNPYREKHMDGTVVKLKLNLNEVDIKAIKNWAQKIAQASINLSRNPKGIGYKVDVTLGTNKQVFSILGPHLGDYYGDVVIIFKRDLMLHPDTNFSIQAATSYGPKGSVYGKRPWIKNPGDPVKSCEQFHFAKLHCAVSGYEYAAATELMALTGLKRKSMDVTLADVLKRWKEVDSHEVFESHLPQLIPLDYIDSVYIPEFIFNVLTPEAQKSAQGAFKNRLFVTKHPLDPSSTTSAPSAITREKYKNDIVREICEKIEKKMEINHYPQGFVVTAVASEFDEQIIIPISISQAFSLYCQEKKRPNDHDLTRSYIYWQAMKGDMMLTIANEHITSDKIQSDSLRCLVCYIAGRPALEREEYQEEYSYLHDHVPQDHRFAVREAKFKAKSNRFHIGCNTEDFLAFCLEINHQNGFIKLSHAGPNSIYNHSTIEYKFSKTELDLSQLKFVHVSAGADDVPIRNLTINFELIIDLHPEVDKTYKPDASILLKKSIPNVHDSNGIVLRTHYPKDLGVKSKKPKEVVIVKTQKVQKKSVISRFFSRMTCRETSVDDTAIYKRADEFTMPTSSKLTPCRDSIYCLHQLSPDHMAKYSHICRFSELCRKKTDEPRLIHLLHKVAQCTDDENCANKDDPVHRAQFRHGNLPDYLVPCRYQKQCRALKGKEHRIKYFHGEQIPGFDQKGANTKNHRSTSDCF